MFLLVTLHVAPLSTWKWTSWAPAFIVAKIFDLKDELSTLFFWAFTRESEAVFLVAWILRSFLSFLGLRFSCLGTLARWFALPHFVNSFPTAMHLSHGLLCFQPQYLHSTNFGLLLFLPLDPCFILWLTAFTSSLSLMAFICVAVVSADRQVSLQHCSVSLASWHSFSFSRLQWGHFLAWFKYGVFYFTALSRRAWQGF